MNDGKARSSVQFFYQNLVTTNYCYPASLLAKGTIFLYVIQIKESTLTPSPNSAHFSWDSLSNFSVATRSRTSASNFPLSSCSWLALACTAEALFSFNSDIWASEARSCPLHRWSSASSCLKMLSWHWSLSNCCFVAASICFCRSHLSFSNFSNERASFSSRDLARRKATTSSIPSPNAGSVLMSLVLPWQ